MHKRLVFLLIVSEETLLCRKSSEQIFSRRFRVFFHCRIIRESIDFWELDSLVRNRKVYAEVPPRVEYALSDIGESMRPIIESMAAWGTAYKEHK